MNVNINLEGLKIDKEKIAAKRKSAEAAIDNLWDGVPGTDWVKLPMSTGEDKIEEIIMTAIACQDSCGLFVVIGNGGSLLGTKAVIEAIDEHISAAPEVIFLGESMSASKYTKVIEKMRHYDVNVCVISKSGETPETIMSYEIIKDAMFARYGAEIAAKRIMIMTGAEDSTLKKLGTKDGCGIFTAPSGFVGNYGILSPSSLFPMAVAGIDVKRFLAGAEVMATDPCWDVDCADYAIARNILFEEGKKVEVFQYENPNMEAFSLWISHLFAESECKNGKGLFTSNMSFARDFKAMGQFLRGHRPDFFETEIITEKLVTDMKIPEALKEHVSAATLNDLNGRLANQMRETFKDENLDRVKISISEMNEFTLGQLVYFFLVSASICGYLHGEDPFERNLVDQYKEKIGF